jgi:predicted GTPase
LIAVIAVILAVWYIDILGQRNVHIKRSVYVIGETGAGKSTLVNNMLGREAFEVVHTANAGNRKNSPQSASIKISSGLFASFFLELTAMDTIGFNDARHDGNDDLLLENLNKSMDYESKNVQTIFLKSLGNGVRMDGTEINLIKKVATMMTPSSPPVIFVLTRSRTQTESSQVETSIRTHWDNTPQAKFLPWAPVFAHLHEKKGDVPLTISHAHTTTVEYEKKDLLALYDTIISNI